MFTEVDICKWINSDTLEIQLTETELNKNNCINGDKTDPNDIDEDESNAAGNITTNVLNPDD